MRGAGRQSRRTDSFGSSAVIAAVTRRRSGSVLAPEQHASFETPFPQGGAEWLA